MVYFEKKSPSYRKNSMGVRSDKRDDQYLSNSLKKHSTAVW